MTARTDGLTLGVEEEYQIVDLKTRGLVPAAREILPAAQQSLGGEAQHELLLSQIETATPVCHTLAKVRARVARERRAMIAAAACDGCGIAAAGTHPFARWEEQEITPKSRYQGLERDYAQLAREHLICGCHVHIGYDDRDAALAVLNGVRLWLAPLLALSASSPFFAGVDTGYASFRTEVWSRWPMAGPPAFFASRNEYDGLVRDLVATGSVEDATNIYWDVRLPEKSPTIEVRVADVCATIDEAVMIAGLTRGLVWTCDEAASRGDPVEAVRPEILRAAHWRAARYGLEGDLVDVAAKRSVPARDAVGALLRFVRPALEELGDWDEVSTLVDDTVGGGASAARQRAAYRRAGRLEDVVDLVVEETARGTE